MYAIRSYYGQLILQTMFLRGEYQGEKIDNTTPEEVEAWISAVKEIHPQQIMMYSLDRDTPVHQLQKVSKEEMEVIADQVRALGFDVSVAG